MPMFEPQGLRVLLLVGGEGRRLRSVVPDLPKPMAEVAGRPFLAWSLERFIRQGFRRFTLLSGFRAEAIESHFRDFSPAPVEISFLRESTPLGTGGAIRAAMEFHGDEENFLVANGDTFFGLPAVDFLAACRAPLTVALARVAEADRYGSVIADEEGRIRRFSEKAAGTGDINAGLYFLHHSLVSEMPRGAFSFERDFLEPRCVDLDFFAYRGDARFLDIGTPEDYQRAAVCLPAWIEAERGEAKG